ASTAAEVERDLSKVSCSMELFELYVKGFLEGCAGSLTDKEVEMLPMGAKVMTYECGMRFLADYLEGDHYFKIHREGHNLDRARTQFKLVADMESKWDTVAAMSRKYAIAYQRQPYARGCVKNSLQTRFFCDILRMSQKTTYAHFSEGANPGDPGGLR